MRNTGFEYASTERTTTVLPELADSVGIGEVTMGKVIRPAGGEGAQ